MAGDGPADPWHAGAVTGGITLLALLIRQWRANRQAKFARLERRRTSTAESVRLAGEREDDRLETVLGQWEKLYGVAVRRAEDAERREQACEDRCTALEERVKALDYDNDFLQGHIMEVERELAKVRIELHRLTP